MIFAFVWAENYLQNISLIYKYVQKKFIFSTHENVFYLINKTVLWSAIYIFWYALSIHCKITYLQLKIQFWLKAMAAILTDMTLKISFFGMTLK